MHIEPLRKSINEGKIETLISDLKRVLSSIKNSDDIKKYLEKGEIIMRKSAKKHDYNQNGIKREAPRAITTLKKYQKGSLLPSVLVEPREHNKMEHPTQKPINLLRKLVLLISDKGDTILDPFMGSGSTGVASLIEGRKFIGCEIDSEYFEIAKRRIGETDKTLRQSLFYGVD